ncbi:class I SAM-dependent methyltransferase [Aquihabitans sp. McL0605]|uniref:class I SAM-dependent methyltransferase n=1 Tax=Aquihabitans sp. McL0605 TaxID=3415671 RepID=UPI003CF5FAFB
MVDALFPTAVPADASWHRYTTARQSPGDNGTTVVYGTELPTETELKLLGTVEGSRILDLGCGTGRNAVALARQGAKVLAVDPSTELLALARDRADAADVRVELHQAGLAELAFLRSDSIDAAVSVMALASADDLARVFRQVHRVLKPEAPLVCSVPHPAFAMIDPTAPDPLRIVRAYDDSSTRTWELDGRDVTDFPRTFADLFTTFSRANFRIDHVIEPTASGPSGRDPGYADVMRTVPATLLLRARKQGN